MINESSLSNGGPNSSSWRIQSKEETSKPSRRHDEPNPLVKLDLNAQNVHYTPTPKPNSMDYWSFPCLR